ncbi:MAG: hypothetical protein ACPGN3_15115 [Opitutales bacterium]
MAGKTDEYGFSQAPTQGFLGEIRVGDEKVDAEAQLGEERENQTH